MTNKEKITQKKHWQLIERNYIHSVTYRKALAYLILLRVQQQVTDLFLKPKLCSMWDMV